MLDLITALVATAVGILIGACGVGGVLLISYLALFTHLSIHQAAATSLFSFLFTGLLGAWLFHRKGSIDWRIALPLCAGALPTSYLGALVAARASTAVLSMIVGLVIVAAGIAMVIARGAGHAQPGRSMARRNPTLLLVGILSGFGSGVSGAGGPVFSVPLMVTLRYASLVAIGASQILQLGSALSGSIGNLQRGLVDWKMAALITVFQLLGVAFGVRLAHSMPERWLKRMTGLLCVLAGAMLIVRA
ncbi:MAG: hypothetical protein ABT05_00895 [Lautropia sp. SCN 66-9]|nr:MAG: hypothetical protein ABT05_00895 [Lautropia sp. SCN 66-9]